MQTATGNPAPPRPASPRPAPPRPPVPKARRPIPLSGKAGVVVQALLLEPERYWGVHALAARAGVSAGLAHRVLLRLDGLRITDRCSGRRSHSRILVDPAALFELWVEENVDRDYRRLDACLPIRRSGANARGVAGRIACALDDAGGVRANLDRRHVASRVLD